MGKWKEGKSWKVSNCQLYWVGWECDSCALWEKSGGVQVREGQRHWVEGWKLGGVGTAAAQHSLLASWILRELGQEGGILLVLSA